VISDNKNSCLTTIRIPGYVVVGKRSKLLKRKEIGWLPISGEEVEKVETEGKTLSSAAAKAGMDEKTARKYLRLGKLPSEVEKTRPWRTRPDPFSEVWEDVRSHLDLNPGLEAKTLFADLQRNYPGCFQDSQLRTSQRRVKAWRALEGPAKEVFFEQVYQPGKLCESDFTHLSSLGVTIQGQLFEPRLSSSRTL
jgi:hypothetical protein